MSPIIEGGMPGGDGADVGGVVGVDDALTTQIHSIDTLSSDIYELRYHLVQANSCMYRYRAERDRYHQERDEAYTSLQEAQVHKLGSMPTFEGIQSRSLAFVHGIYQ